MQTTCQASELGPRESLRSSRPRALVARIAAGVALCLAAAGCTASVPSTGVLTSWPPGDFARSLVIAVPEDAALPAGFVDEVESATGIRITEVVATEPQMKAVLSATIDAVPVDDEEEEEQLRQLRSAQAALGLPDGAAEVAGATGNTGGLAATQYGEDDLCKLIDLSWYSANNIPVPNPPGKDLEEGVRSGSVLLTARPQGNTGTSSRWQLIPGTCEATEVFLIPLSSNTAGRSTSEALETFGSYLVSPDGQEAIARYGLAFPLGTQPGTEIAISPTETFTIKVVRPNS